MYTVNPTNILRGALIKNPEGVSITMVRVFGELVMRECNYNCSVKNEKVAVVEAVEMDNEFKWDEEVIKFSDSSENISEEKLKTLEYVLPEYIFNAFKLAILDKRV